MIDVFKQNGFWISSLGLVIYVALEYAGVFISTYICSRTLGTPFGFDIALGVYVMLFVFRYFMRVD